MPMLQVLRVVESVVGDPTGTWIRNHARDAVRGGRCGAACSCREVQIRLIDREEDEVAVQKPVGQSRGSL